MRSRPVPVSTDGLRQRRQRARRVAVELHEHQVPDLEEAARVARRDRRPGTARRRGPRSRWISVQGPHGPVSPIAQKFSASPSRKMRLAGTPISFAQIAAASSSSRKTVTTEPARVEPEALGHQLPGERDRLLLEVVAEGEVPEHLEEGVVARAAADLFQVVVLARDAHALLRGGGALVGARLLAGEHALEGHHAGVGEQQRRVARHQRGARDARVPPSTRRSAGRPRGSRLASRGADTHPPGDEPRKIPDASRGARTAR